MAPLLSSISTPRPDHAYAQSNETKQFPRLLTPPNSRSSQMVCCYTCIFDVGDSLFAGLAENCSNSNFELQSIKSAASAASSGRLHSQHT